MIERYANKQISETFSDATKVKLWQKTELAVIEAREILRIIPKGTHEKISSILLSTPIDLNWWKEKEKETKHDLNAFILERVRYLPVELQNYFHDEMTSYDTEETPFMIMLLDACDFIEEFYGKFEKSLISFSKANRYTVMIARTHGQEAKLKSLGTRGLSWLADLRTAHEFLSFAIAKLHLSKISGATGNYGEMEPIVEKLALIILGFKPYYGATQIMPRIIHAQLADALCNMAIQINKIALDIRLNARSGRPLLQEPFGKKQTGSTAMPHKKNTILTEQMEGMERMAEGFAGMIKKNIVTWEERSIEQSCVERVAWPDLFHVVIRMLEVMTKVIDGITIYRDNMLEEVVLSRGVYSSEEAKVFIKNKLSREGLSYEDCYRLVQLACFNVFEVDDERKQIRETVPRGFTYTDEILTVIPKCLKEDYPVSIEHLISTASLHINEQLGVTEDEVSNYNRLLEKLFSTENIKAEWHTIFMPSHLLKNEDYLYEKILGI